jgi:hypothetical protein
MIENTDPTVSSPLQLGGSFRLRNLATGGYLLSHCMGSEFVGDANRSSLDSSLLHQAASPRRNLPHASSSQKGSAFARSAGGRVAAETRNTDRNTRVFVSSAFGEAQDASYVAFCGQESSLLRLYMCYILSCAQVRSVFTAQGPGFRDSEWVEI